MLVPDKLASVVLRLLTALIAVVTADTLYLTEEGPTFDALELLYWPLFAAAKSSLPSITPGPENATLPPPTPMLPAIVSLAIESWLVPVPSYNTVYAAIPPTFSAAFALVARSLTVVTPVIWTLSEAPAAIVMPVGLSTNT